MSRRRYYLLLKPVLQEHEGFAQLVGRPFATRAEAEAAREALVDDYFREGDYDIAEGEGPSA
jgi:hypothetical protein